MRKIWQRRIALSPMANPGARDSWMMAFSNISTCEHCRKRVHTQDHCWRLSDQRPGNKQERVKSSAHITQALHTVTQNVARRTNCKNLPGQHRQRRRQSQAAPHKSRYQPFTHLATFLSISRLKYRTRAVTPCTPHSQQA